MRRMGSGSAACEAAERPMDVTAMMREGGGEGSVVSVLKRAWVTRSGGEMSMPRVMWNFGVPPVCERYHERVDSRVRREGGERTDGEEEDVDARGVAF